MTSLNIRVQVPALNSTKMLRFDDSMTIQDVIDSIVDKVPLSGEDYGILVPAEHDPHALGQWAMLDKTMTYYDLNQNDLIIYRTKQEAIKVRLIDDTIKTVFVDLSQSVAEMVDFIGHKIGLKNSNEFGMKEEGSLHWLKPHLHLISQTKNLGQTFVLKKRFFVTDAAVGVEDPMELHLVYCQLKDVIIHSTHPCNKEDAIQLAALQAQIVHGNYIPEVHKEGWLNTKEFLPEEYRSKDTERKTLEEWKKLPGLNDLNARFRYIQYCRSLKTYGMTSFKVRTKVPGKKKLKDILLCISKRAIALMDTEEKKTFKEHPIDHLRKWLASPETITLDFGGYETEPIVLVTPEGDSIAFLVGGYIDIILKRRGVITIDDPDTF